MIEILDSRGFISAALTSLITFITLLAKSPREPYRPPCRECLSFWVLSQQKRMESRRTSISSVLSRVPEFSGVHWISVMDR